MWRNYANIWTCLRMYVWNVHPGLIPFSYTPLPLKVVWNEIHAHTHTGHSDVTDSCEHILLTSVDGVDRFTHVVQRRSLANDAERTDERDGCEQPEHEPIKHHWHELPVLFHLSTTSSVITRHLFHGRTRSPYLYHCVYSGITCRKRMSAALRVVTPRECSYAWPTATI